VYLQPNAPRTIGGVIDDAIKLYRASFRTCWPIALIASVVSAATLLYVLSRFPAIATVRDPAQMWQLVQAPSVWGWYLVLSVVSLVLLGAIIACQNALAAGAAPMTVGQALSAAFARLHWQLLAILLWVLYIGLIALIMLMPLSGALKVLGALAWLIFGIYLWGRVQLWVVALFAEPVGTVQAMRVSWDLIRGHWWRAATILTVGIIIVLVITMIFGFVGGLVIVMFRLDPMSLIIGNQLIGAAERIFVTSMIPALMVAMYYDFKLRREGGDLAARTKSLQTA
jgi:hypothetical protein